MLLWDSMSQVTHGLSDTIGYSFSCWWQLPFNGTCTDWMICRQLYLAELLSLVTYVLCLHVASKWMAAGTGRHWHWQAI